MVAVDISLLSIEYPAAEIYAATDNLHPDNLLGTGTYGSVYRGVLRDGTEVAVKVLDAVEVMSGFEEEIQVLSRFRHPNLVILLGFARSGNKRFLIYELLAGGDVYKKLKTANTERDFPWTQRLSIFLDAACGLSHLLNSQPCCYHRDIKISNILLDRNGTAKMSDFGLSCLNGSASVGSSMRVSQASGTVGYACPLYIQKGLVSETSEVYSFGMVMLELLTGMPPARVGRDPSEIVYLVNHIGGDIKRVLGLLDRRARWPLKVSQALAELALQCASFNEPARPRFIEIVTRLRNISTKSFGSSQRSLSPTGFVHSFRPVGSGSQVHYDQGGSGTGGIGGPGVTGGSVALGGGSGATRSVSPRPRSPRPRSPRPRSPRPRSPRPRSPHKPWIHFTSRVPSHHVSRPAPPAFVDAGESAAPPFRVFFARPMCAHFVDPGPDGVLVFGRQEASVAGLPAELQNMISREHVEIALVDKRIHLSNRGRNQVEIEVAGIAPFFLTSGEKVSLASGDFHIRFVTGIYDANRYDGFLTLRVEVPNKLPVARLEIVSRGPHEDPLEVFEGGTALVESEEAPLFQVTHEPDLFASGFSVKALHHAGLSLCSVSKVSKSMKSFFLRAGERTHIDADDYVRINENLVFQFKVLSAAPPCASPPCASPSCASPPMVKSDSPVPKYIVPEQGNDRVLPSGYRGHARFLNS